MKLKDLIVKLESFRDGYDGLTPGPELEVSMITETEDNGQVEQEVADVAISDTGWVVLLPKNF